MSGNTVRLQAINNVEAYTPPAVSFVPGEEPGSIFGSNVFTKAEMQGRLPKSIYKSVVATITTTRPLWMSSPLGHSRGMAKERAKLPLPSVTALAYC